MKCKQHPKYDGIKMPEQECKTCIHNYLLTNRMTLKEANKVHKTFEKGVKYLTSCE